MTRIVDRAAGTRKFRPTLRAAGSRRARESGLTNTRARADRLGGRCRVESTPGAGTTVDWVVPVA